METPGSPEFTPKPELKHKRTDKMLEYAREKQRWLKLRVPDERMMFAIDGLVEELNNYLSMEFTGMPEVIVTGKDIYHSRVSSSGPDTIIVEKELLPLEGDALLYNEHTLKGILYEFHCGEANDLRAYVSTGQEPVRYLGGIITPMLSVGVETNKMQLAEESKNEEINELIFIITEQMRNYSTEVNELVEDLVRSINERQTTLIEKLQDASSLIARVARKSEVTIPFVDALLEMVKMRLHLDLPHDIYTSAYRAVISEKPVSSYKAQGPEEFLGVVVQIGLIGESSNKGLGLFFLSGETPVQIPVQYITMMQSVEGE